MQLKEEIYERIHGLVIFIMSRLRILKYKNNTCYYALIFEDSEKDPFIMLDLGDNIQEVMSLIKKLRENYPEAGLGIDCN